MTTLAQPVAACLLLLFLPRGALCQDVAGELRARIDGIAQAAYQSASAAFPCKVKTRGKPKMMRWEEVDRCLNSAANLVDWESVARQLSSLHAENPRTSLNDFHDAVDASLSAHALVYEKVFAVKDPKTLLPLTNSLLKFLPAASLENLPVFDKAGTQVGTFLSTYSYERAGGLSSANTYRLALFQYTDLNGNVQPVADRLLLDSFGIPWQDARKERGLRLPAEKLRERIQNSKSRSQN